MEDKIQGLDGAFTSDVPAEFQDAWLGTISRFSAFSLPCPVEVERWGKESAQ